MKPRIADLFCCAGGAAEGYARAGFDVIGFDIEPQPRYPHHFVQADVSLLEAEDLDGFDAVHASPPCQGYSPMRHAPGARGAPRLIAPVRRLLERWAARRRPWRPAPWVIENVEEARVEMRDPLLLCGTMFGLGARGAQLQRHRLFEANIPLTAPMACQHDSARPVLGVYGGHARIRSARFGGRSTRDAWEGGHKPVAAEAMGMTWATLTEMSEAIPPAYTQWVGQQLIEHLNSGGSAPVPLLEIAHG